LIVLDQPDSLIQVILPKYAFGPPEGPRVQAEFMVDDHTGIPGALSRCADFHEMVAVFCADNLYPVEEELPLIRRAVVRAVGITEAMTHLDWHDGKQWRHRDPDKIGGFALSTPWLLTPEDLKEGASFNDVVAWFNSIKLPARMMPYSHEWRDIGTEDSYKAIWKEWP
jgi:hypothetical protein